MPVERRGQNGWTLVSRAAGLSIVVVVVVLVCASFLTRRTYDVLTVQTLLLIAAWLIGGPTLIGWLLRKSDGGGG